LARQLVAACEEKNHAVVVVAKVLGGVFWHRRLRFAKTKTRKVIAFLHPYFKHKLGATLVGTFSSAIDPAGDKLYIAWNVSRAWDYCGLTVIHIPESERRP
jgi:hypothetical protein